jgi:hypothetical protein
MILHNADRLLFVHDRAILQADEIADLILGSQSKVQLVGSQFVFPLFGFSFVPVLDPGLDGLGGRLCLNAVVFLRLCDVAMRSGVADELQRDPSFDSL